MAPVPGELHIDRYLTNVSIEYQQAASSFIAPRVFPIVPVNKQSDKFVIFERDSFWRDNFPKRALGGRADVADWTKSEGQYFAEERALAHKYDDRQKSNVDEPIDIRVQATNLLTSRAMVNMDRRWVDEYFKTGVWSDDIQGVSSGPGSSEFLQFDQSGSDPVAVIDELKETMFKSTAQEPNKMVVGARVHRILKNHEEILDRIKYTQRGVITNDLLAAMFDVDDYIVARSIYNKAKEGQDLDADFIASDDAILLAHAAPTPALNTPSAGYTFAWQNLLGGNTSPMGTAVMRGRDEFAHSDHFEVRVANDMNLVASDLGLFLYDTIGA